MKKKPVVEKSRAKIVVKANKLVEAKYRLTLREMKVILALIANVDAFDADLMEYEISMEALKELISPTADEEVKIWGDRFEVFRNIFNELKSKPLNIDYDIEGVGKGVQVINWINDVDIQKYSGLIRYSFSPLLKPYLLQLKKNFTTYSLSDIVRLKSFYAIRIYELMAQYERIGRRRFTLVELRQLLGIEDNEYQLYGHLKSRVILPAQSELAASTRLSFEFIEKTKGRKVEAIEFIISGKGKNEPAETVIPQPAVVANTLFTPGETYELSPIQQQLAKLGVTPEQILKLWRKGFGLVRKDVMDEVSIKFNSFDDYAAEKALMLEAQMLKTSVPDPYNWLRKAIEENWQESNTAKRKRQAVKSAQVQKQLAAIERELRELKLQKNAAETLVIEQFLGANPDILSELVRQARAENQLLNSLYELHLSEFANYQKGSATLRPAVNQKVRDLRPDLLSSVDARFAPELERLHGYLAMAQ